MCCYQDLLALDLRLGGDEAAKVQRQATDNPENFFLEDKFSAIPKPAKS